MPRLGFAMPWAVFLQHAQAAVCYPHHLHQWQSRLCRCNCLHGAVFGHARAPCPSARPSQLGSTPLHWGKQKQQMKPKQAGKQTSDPVFGSDRPAAFSRAPMRRKFPLSTNPRQARRAPKGQRSSRRLQFIPKNIPNVPRGLFVLPSSFTQVRSTEGSVTSGMSTHSSGAAVFTFLLHLLGLGRHLPLYMLV